MYLFTAYANEPFRLRTPVPFYFSDNAEGDCSGPASCRSSSVGCVLLVPLAQRLFFCGLQAEDVSFSLSSFELVATSHTMRVGLFSYAVMHRDRKPTEITSSSSS